MNLSNFFRKKNDKKQEADIKLLKTWYQDAYQKAIIQRNFFILLTILSIVVIMLSVLVIRYIKNTKSIEPFVIEIEPKTGVPTVVDPITIKDYSANQAIKRYFVMKYIRAREGYLYSTFQNDYSLVVRVLSSSDVYYNDYRPKFSANNPNSPYSLYGQNSTRSVYWKSIIFPSDNSAQIRLTIEVSGANSAKMDKIVFMEFAFQNIEMNDEERLVNPLGFIVTLYRIEDENSG